MTAESFPADGPEAPRPQEEVKRRKPKLRSAKDRAGGGWAFAADENPIGRKVAEPLDWAVALALAAFFAAVHAATSFFWVFPGDSARYVAAIFGISPPPLPAEQAFIGLFRVLASAVGDANRTAAASALTLFFSSVSLVWTYLLAVALFRMMLDLVHLRAGVSGGARWGWRVPRMAGALAVLALGFSAPFWTASTRVNADSFHFSLLMLAAYLNVRYIASGRLGTLVWAAAIYGALCTQSGAAVQALPVFAVATFISAFRSERPIALSLVLPAAVAALSAMAAAAACTVSFMHGEVFRVMRWSGPGQVSAALVLANVASALSAFNQPHWMILGAITFLPFVSFLAFGHWSLDATRHLALRALEIVVLAASVLVLSCSRYSPWGLLGFRPELVFSYFMAAVCFAYGVSCAWMQALFAFSGTAPHAFPGARAFGAALRAGVLAAALAFLAFEAWTGCKAADTRTAKFLLTYVDGVIDGLDGRDLLVTDYVLEDVVRIRARERGLDLSVVNPADRPLSTSRRLMREKISDQALLNAFDLGIMQFFREYIGSVPEAGRRVALTYFPDLWNFGRYRAYPHGLCFVGVPEGAPPDDPLGEGGEDPVGANVAAWRAMAGKLADELAAVPEDSSAALLAAARIVRQRVSFLGNDLAYWLDVTGRRDEALALWRDVHAFAPSNLSAALNLVYALRRSGAAGAEAEKAEADLSRLRHRLDGPMEVWDLSRSQGRIASPDAFASLGLAWAQSEQPGLAVGVIDSAVRDGMLDRDSPGGVSTLLLALGAVTGGAGDATASERAFAQALEGDPGSAIALAGLAGARLALGDTAGAAPLVERLEALGADPARVARLKMNMFIAGGDFDSAVAAVEKALASSQGNPDLMLDLFATLSARMVSAPPGSAAAAADRKKMEERSSRLKLDPAVRTFQGAIAAATLHLIDGKFAEARDEFRVADSSRPGIPGLVNQILRLDYALGDRFLAEEHARRLLAVSPDHGFANYIMGSLALGAGRLGSAMAFLERSVANWNSAVPRGDLAYALYLGGETDRAEETARESIAMDGSHCEVWDTLGLVLLAKNLPGEALDAFDKALETEKAALERDELERKAALERERERGRADADYGFGAGFGAGGAAAKPENRGNMALRIHRARALFETGDAAAARAALDSLSGTPGSLAPEDRTFLSSLRADLAK